jgi:hypothetical protein
MPRLDHRAAGRTQPGDKASGPLSTVTPQLSPPSSKTSSLPILHQEPSPGRVRMQHARTAPGRPMCR